MHCDNIAQWEQAHNIQKRDKMPDPHMVIQDEEESNEVKTLRGILQKHDRSQRTRPTDIDHLQILDNLPLQNLLTNLYSSSYTQSERHVDALPRIWKNMDSYIQSNYVYTWISQTSQYFNHVMRTEHGSWQEEIA